jgi:Domain of unknown function(DUF2779)
MINKTLFQLYLTCPEEAWLSHHLPATIVPPTEDVIFRMQQGNEVDHFARALFKDKKFLREVNIQDREIHFQYRVEADGFIAIADVIALDKSTQSIDLLEVKASSDYDKVVNDYTNDAAFQCQVFERAGFTVRNVYILYLNPTYIFEGHPIKASAFFRHPNISQGVHKLLPTIKKKCDELKKYLTQPEPAKYLKHCKNKQNCTFFQKHFHDELPAYSIFDISRISEKSLRGLLEQHILDIQDIPSDFKLSDNQRLQVNIAQGNFEYIEQKVIDQTLNDLKYPLYFLDYETINAVFPLQTGMKPYTQMVFQYSMHILEHPDGNLRHAEYLLNATDEPVTNLLAHLQKHLLADGGSVVVWNESFEKGRNKEMAVRYPEYAAFLEDVNHRVFDLMVFFQKFQYQIPAFKGSYSIKAILPALVPAFSYKDLVVQNGTQAVVTWYNAVTTEQEDSVKNKIFDDLKAYCHLDTLAMYEIFAFLKK